MNNRSVLVVALAVVLSSSVLFARPLVENQDNQASLFGPPAYCTAMHDVGQLITTITNYGVIGDGFIVGQNLDCFSGVPLISGEYPKGSHTKYLYAGAIWVGAIKGNDTLVSVGHDGWQLCRELNPDESPAGDLIYKSTLSEDPVIRDGAVSEQDYIAVFTDTFTSGVPDLKDDYIDHRPHVPLPIQVTQRTYAWSEAVAQDFVVFNCSVRNIGADTLRDVYIGIYVDGDVMGDPTDVNEIFDDVVGFRKVPLSPAFECPASVDSVPVAWIADNDGNLSSLKPCPSITGMALLQIPMDSPKVSFNWWLPNGDSTLDYGPYLKANYRNFSTGGSGVPEGDRNKYFLLRNGERDFDQVFLAQTAAQDTSWAVPVQQLIDWATVGTDARYLLSFGPFTLAPDISLPFVYAYVGGENLHSVIGNLQNLPNNPDAYMANLDFSDMDANVRSADALVDNPGVDSDGDGNKGKFLVCEGDTIFIKGDWVPDFTPFVRSCCIGVRGNVNQSVDGLVDLSDLSLMVLYLTSRFGEVALPCLDEANINALGIVDLSDLTYEITYLTSPPGEFTLPRCP